MKVIIPTKTLTETLGHVERVIPSRSSNPGLSLLKVEIDDGRLTFSGSNMDIDVRSVVETDVTGRAEVALPAAVFTQVARALPADTVELDVGDAEVEVRSGTFATRLQLVTAESAPLLEFVDELPGEVDGALLARALEHVRYAAAVADYQAVFRGVKWELRDGHLRVVATDGFRLASYHVDVTSGIDADFIIPARSVDELIKTLVPGPARLALDGGQLTVASGGTTLNLKRMDGTFPDYQRVIPQAFPVNVTLAPQRLADAVARVAVMADKSANHRVDLFIKDGVLRITAEGSFGRAQEAIDVLQEGTEDEIALAYNAKYLADAVGPVVGDLQLRFSGTTSPSVLRDLGDPAYLAMVVPLRTG
ncbi:MAG: DNA polymerase III subunit beta [Trueperaceae bacterium]|nr:DNA polymerase III subunit beta [Trueperaceae bacterium]